jgi:hypothetical protein
VPAPLNGLMHRVFEAGTLRALTVSRRSAGAAYPSMMTASTVRGLDMGRPARDPPFGGDSQRLRADVRISGIDASGRTSSPRTLLTRALRCHKPGARKIIGSGGARQCQRSSSVIRISISGLHRQLRGADAARI